MIINSKFLIFNLTLCLLSWAFGFNQNQDQQEEIILNPLTVEKVYPIEFKENEKNSFKIEFKLHPNFHAYLDQFKVEIESPPFLYLSEPQITPIVEFLDPVTKKIKVGTKGFGEILTIVEISKDSLAQFKLRQSPVDTNQVASLYLTFQACTKTYCLFPQKIPLQTEFIFESHEATSVEHNRSQHSFESQINASTSSQNRLNRALSKSFWWALIIVFFAGVLTSFTPCIFPMIPITLAVLGTRAKNKVELESRWQGFSISLCYVLGIAITYSLLGYTAARTGALFGSFLGHPIAQVSIASIFILMALSFFGLFEIKMPDQITNFLQNKLNQIGLGQGYISAVIYGLAAGVIASPCVGPILVSILTFVAESQNAFWGLVLLFTFALGLGQIFIILGTFSHWINKLPRSGPWLKNIKIIFGVMMLGLALFYIWPLLKQTPWLRYVLLQNSSPLSTSQKPQWNQLTPRSLEDAIAQKKPIIIDFKADWCVACKELDQFTFSDSRVLESGQDFVWLYFDATQPSPELNKWKKKFEIFGLPFVTFYDRKGEWRKDLTLTGFEKADLFLDRMEKAKSNKFTK